MKKAYEYKTIVIEDRGFITDVVFLHALNIEGAAGWRHKEEQVMGAKKLAVLLEREILVEEYVQETSDPEILQELDGGNKS